MKDKIFTAEQALLEYKKDIAKRAIKRALTFYLCSMLLSVTIGYVYGQEAKNCSDGWLVGGIFVFIFSVFTLLAYYKDRENLEREYGLHKDGA